MSEYLIKRSAEKKPLSEFVNEEFSHAGIEMTLRNNQIELLNRAIDKYFLSVYEPITLPEITASIVSKKDIEILHQTTAKNEWKLLREETLAELNKVRELNESLSETILQQNVEIVELKNRLAEKK